MGEPLAAGVRWPGRLRRRVRAMSGPAVAMWLVVAGYLVALAMHGNGYSLWIDGWLGPVAIWMPALVCWAAVVRRRLWSIPSVAVSLAVTCFALGDQYYILASDGGAGIPDISLADAGYLAVYPLMFIALAATVRRRAPQWAQSVLLDAAVGALGAAAVLAVVLDPVLSPETEDPLSAAAVVSAAYPLMDLVLISAAVGMAAAPKLQLGRSGVPLIAGLFVFAFSDAAYALLTAEDAYVIGTLLDAGWVLGLALMAVWVEHPPAEVAPGPAPGQPHALAVSTTATLAGLSILTMGAFTLVPGRAVLLSCLTLVLAALRAQVAFRDLAKMADLRVLSRTDDLTGLPNRRAFHADVPDVLAAEKRGALLIMDLDKFKEVNDGLGHEYGDMLLAEVGQRLAGHVRAVDVLARIGGDEFAVLLPAAGRTHAAARAAELRAAVGAPVTLDGITLRPDVSIGIALWPDEGNDLSGLLRKADVAMYRAKTSRSGHHVYSAADDTRGAERLRDLEELRIALTCGHLTLYYQPKLDVASGLIDGVEVLIRWDHGNRGMLKPGEFLPLLEEAGLMPRMTDWVLEQALDQARSWQSGGRSLTVAVNISAASLADDTLPDRVAAMIAARRLPPAALTLEITEDFLVADPARARLILLRLRQTGIRISIDDFGTGYSSLAYLRDLPLDELKLDQSFVASLGADPRATTLVQTTVTLAHGLGLRMVAEGVENREAFEELQRLGCDEVQGYLIARPMPAADLTGWLAARSGAGNTDPGPGSRPPADPARGVKSISPR
ncbi:MAG: EAL domain-containing protein [Arthrobacter oryzae]